MVWTETSDTRMCQFKRTVQYTKCLSQICRELVRMKYDLKINLFK